MKKLIYFLAAVALFTSHFSLLTLPCFTQNINTFAGNGTFGFSGDGGAAISAQLFWPLGVAVDASGNVYIADNNNHRIRKVNTSGVISTFAGDGTSAFGGDGGVAISAQLNYPAGVAFDASGNVYIADRSNNRIRKVNTSGDISTFAGDGTAAFGGDGGAAISAQLRYPYGVAVDASGNIYISDSDNHRIRKVGSAPTSVELLTFSAEKFNIISIYPNPASDYIQYLLGSEEGGAVTVTLYDALGREVLRKEETISAGIFKEKISTVNFSSGNYLLRITNGKKEKAQKQFVIK